MMSNMIAIPLLITGSSSGIGAATAVLLAKSGANVVITGRNAENVSKVSKQCSNVSPKRLKPLEVVADVNKEEDLNRLLDTTIKTFGKLDILVNNAGFGNATKITESDYMQKFEGIFQTNVNSVVALITGSSSGIGAATAVLLAKSGANVVITGRNAENVSKISKQCSDVSPKRLKPLEVVSDVNKEEDLNRLLDTTIKTFGKLDILVNNGHSMAPYCMSKTALDMFTKCMAAELGPKHIRVNSVKLYHKLAVEDMEVTDEEVMAGMAEGMVAMDGVMAVMAEGTVVTDEDMEVMGEDFTAKQLTLHSL
ncbi:unnamed protein product [Oppiella nova]|uniref:Uncharacterized protein n=1 Tax=Oppiella nova TaxID=334625 RepID=A0A7R9QGL4_9ACAR|nr:unnamed protein product [Oppiella nova]CAG2165455.1 unnamed protein product [Oppiella nova]